MIYTVLIILISAALTGLSILSVKKPELYRHMIYVNLALTLVGSAVVIASHLIAKNKIDMFASDVSFHSWATDFYNLYYMIALPAFGLLLLISIIAAVIGLFDSRQLSGLPKFLRVIVSVASSVFLMLIPYYGLITQNDNVQFYTYIMASGIGQALIIRLSDMIGSIKTKHNSELNTAVSKGK